jgi:hypothetical protein
MKTPSAFLLVAALAWTQTARATCVVLEGKSLRQSTGDRESDAKSNAHKGADQAFDQMDEVEGDAAGGKEKPLLYLVRQKMGSEAATEVPYPPGLPLELSGNKFVVSLVHSAKTGCEELAWIDQAPTANRTHIVGSLNSWVGSKAPFNDYLGKEAPGWEAKSEGEDIVFINSGTQERKSLSLADARRVRFDRSTPVKLNGQDYRLAWSAGFSAVLLTGVDEGRLLSQPDRQAGSAYQDKGNSFVLHGDGDSVKLFGNKEYISPASAESGRRASEADAQNGKANLEKMSGSLKDRVGGETSEWGAKDPGAGPAAAAGGSPAQGPGPVANQARLDQMAQAEQALSDGRQQKGLRIAAPPAVPGPAAKVPGDGRSPSEQAVENGGTPGPSALIAEGMAEPGLAKKAVLKAAAGPAPAIADAADSASAELDREAAAVSAADDAAGRAALKALTEECRDQAVAYLAKNKGFGTDPKQYTPDQTATLKRYAVRCVETRS